MGSAHEIPLRYFEWVDQLVITHESCILGKALDKDFLSGTQEIRKRGEAKHTN
jgi:hypothetical protein